MNLKNELIQRIKTESPLSVYLRDYFNISNTKLFEINQEYINFLLKYDKGYYKDIESFINHSNSFLIDSLLNLKQLSPFHLEKIYLSKLNLKRGHLGHKGYFFFNDPLFDFNFISQLFNEIELIKEKEDALAKFVIDSYKKVLGDEKVGNIRKQIEFETLKQNNLLDTDSKTQKEILLQQEYIIDKKITEYLFNEYTPDIKSKIFEKMKYQELEKKTLEDEKGFHVFKSFAEYNEEYSIENLQSEISSRRNITLKNFLMKIYNKISYISFLEFYFEMLGLDNSFKRIDKKDKRLVDIKNLFKKNKEDLKIYKELKKAIEEKEYLFLSLQEYLNLTNISTDTKENLININLEDKKLENLPAIQMENFDFFDKYNNFFLEKLLRTDPGKYKAYLSKKTFLTQNKNKISGNGKEELTKIIDKMLSLMNINSIEEIFGKNEKRDYLEKDIEIFQMIIDEGKKKEKNNEQNLIHLMNMLNLQTLKSQSFINKEYNTQNIFIKAYKKYFINKYKVKTHDYENLVISDSEFEQKINSFFKELEIDITLDNKEFISNIKKIKKEKKWIEKLLGDEAISLKINTTLKIDLEELYLFWISINKSNELINLDKKSIVRKKIYEKIIKSDKLLLNSLILDFVENESELNRHYDLSFNYFIDFKKIDILINSFFFKERNLTSEYITLLLKNYIYPEIKNISFYNSFLKPNRLNFLEQQENENTYFQMKKYSVYIDFFKQATINKNKFISNIINKEEFELNEKKNEEKLKEQIGEEAENNIYYLKYKKVKEKTNELILFNGFLKEEKEIEERSEEIENISKIAFSEVFKTREIRSTDVSMIVKILDHIKQAEEIELLYLIYHIVYSNVVIEKGENFLTITIGAKVYVILAKIDINTLNNSVLFIQDQFPDKEHVFIFVNADIFYFIFDKINTKLNIFGITVLSRNILSYMYYHKKVSDLDFYGSKEKNLSRVKMRIDGTYKHMKWSNGSQDQYIFTFNELENFISDMFALGATIGDTAVEDPVFTVGGVKFRTSIMRDGDDISISIRKTEHTATLYNSLKGEELSKKMKDLYGLSPCIYQIFVPPADVTLEMSYTQKDIEIMKAYAEQDRGLFLVIGKTRSGKSTSIRNLLDYIYESSMDKGKEIKIITLEDPIESKNINFNQIQVKSDPKAFQQMIKGIKRQDPDSLLVGEIRDSSTLLQTTELANMLGTFSTMHITNPLDGLFTLNGYAVQNNVSLMDIINILKIIVSQKLINRINTKKTSALIEKYGPTNYIELEREGLFLYRSKEEIEIFLKTVATDWLGSILARADGDDETIDIHNQKEDNRSDLEKEYDGFMNRYKEGKLKKDDAMFIEGFLLFEKKTWDLYEKQGYLIKDLAEQNTTPYLYYDYLHNKFIQANLDLVLRLSDKDTPIKLVKDLFVSSFELKEEKAMKDYFDGKLPFFGEGLNKLDTPFYPFILKKMISK